MVSTSSLNPPGDRWRRPDGSPPRRLLEIRLLRGLLMERLRWPEALATLDEEPRLSPVQERQNLGGETLRQLG